MIGQLHGDKPLADLAHTEERARGERIPKGAYDLRPAGGEQLLNRRRKRVGEAKRGIDGRCVAPRLDRGDELAADAGAAGKLGLAPPTGKPALAEARSMTACGQDLDYGATIMAHRTPVLSVTALLGALLLGACGSSGSGDGNGKKTTADGRSPARAPAGAAAAPTVLAAASLTKVFPAIDSHARYTFGGSGALETDIEQGAPADVFAAASPKQPAALLAKGLIGKPVEFATNTLVLIVPVGNPAHISSVSDITRRGVKLVICNATVPCGDYARTTFANLGITTLAMKNVVSQTTDVTQTVADVATGQADAGFVYITDAKAAAGKVKVVTLPAASKPGTEDEVAVVKAGMHQAAARAFVARLMSAAGQAKLRAAGFGAP
jgi:molybdate transport system substrate-binding protein